MDRSDEALIVAHGHGDPEAFAELLRRHGPSLFSYLLRMNRTREQAEDLFQDTFQRVHQQASTFRARGSFRSWLFAIASNLSVDAFRKQRREPPSVHLDTGGDCPWTDARGPQSTISPAAPRASQPVAEAIIAERRARVRRALDQLPPRQRATVVLVYYQQLSHREAARALGCSLGTVKRQMFRALRTLAALLPDIEEGAQ